MYTLFNCFGSVFQVVDDALKSATETQEKTSKVANEKFKKAVNAMIDSRKNTTFRKSVTDSMAEAEANDESSSKTLSKVKATLKETFAQALSHTNTDP